MWNQVDGIESWRRDDEAVDGNLRTVIGMMMMRTMERPRRGFISSLVKLKRKNTKPEQSHSDTEMFRPSRYSTRVYQLQFQDRCCTLFPEIELSGCVMDIFNIFPIPSVSLQKSALQLVSISSHVTETPDSDIPILQFFLFLPDQP